MTQKIDAKEHKRMMEEAKKIAQEKRKKNAEMTLSAEERAKEKLEKEREIVMYAFANDLANLRANIAEAANYADTYNEMKEKKEQHKTGFDGVKRNIEYYAELHFQYKIASKYMQIQLFRKMAEKNILLKELEDFIKKNVE